VRFDADIAQQMICQVLKLGGELHRRFRLKGMQDAPEKRL